MAGYSTPYTFANYIGEWANDAAVLTEIRARKWDSTADGTGAARNGMEYYATGAHQMRMYVAGAWVATGTSVSSTLDFAYNASAGPAVITVDAGDVTWNQTGAFSFVVDVSACTGAADGFGVEDGTDYLRATHAAVNTLNLMGALGVLNLAASGAATIDSDTVATFSGRSVAIDADGGPVDVDATGAVSINSSAAAINIGDDAVAQAINIGTGGAARAITIGNATGATAVDIKSGTGGINLHDGIAQLDLDGAGALTEVALVSAVITPSGVLTLRGGGISQFGDDVGYFNFDGAGALSTSGITTVDLDCSGAFSINSTGGAINIGDDADAQNINIGTGGAVRTITIGNATGATAVDIKSGTGGINLHDGIAQLDLDGAGALTEVALVSADITPSGALTLRGGGVSQFGDDVGYFNFDGAGALTTAGITTVDLDCSGLLQINSSAGAISIGNDVIAQNVNLGTGGARTIAIGSAAAMAVNIDAITFSIDATTTSNITVTGSAQSLALAVVGGGAQKLTIDSAGTGVDSIDITSSVGGIQLTSALGVDIVGAATVSTTLGVTGILSCNSIIMGANQYIAGTAATKGAFIPDNISQTLRSMFLTTGTLGNHIVICEYADSTFDFGQIQRLTPTLIGHSSRQSQVEYWSLTHDTANVVNSTAFGGHTFTTQAQRSRGTITFPGGVPIADETFVLNATTLTWKADGSGDVDHVTIGPDAPGCVINLVASIAECTESGNLTAWDGVGDTVVVEWGTGGVAGNAIVFTEACTNMTMDGAGTLGATHAGIAAATLLDIDEGGPAAIKYPLRGTTSLWRNYRQLGANSIGIGVTGATYIPPDPAGANASLGGLHLDNAPSDEYLHFEWDVHDDWDGVSDITVKIFFEQESAGGGGGQTTVFDLGVVYKQPNESTSKGQNLTESSITGAGAVKEQWVQTFTVVHNPGGGMDVEVNDLFTGTLWWDDVTSTDATHPIVNHIEIYYPSKQPALEA